MLVQGLHIMHMPYFIIRCLLLLVYYSEEYMYVHVYVYQPAVAEYYASQRPACTYLNHEKDLRDKTTKMAEASRL